MPGLWRTQGQARLICSPVAQPRGLYEKQGSRLQAGLRWLCWALSALSIQQTKLIYIVCLFSIMERADVAFSGEPPSLLCFLPSWTGPGAALVPSSPALARRTPQEHLSKHGGSRVALYPNRCPVQGMSSFGDLPRRKDEDALG